MEVEMEKYGFVYIWFDKKHKRYYIGSHWGTENDGYTTGQSWSRNAIKRRPQDFRRRILEKNVKREHLIWSERCWLWFITPDKLGKRYYNLNREPMRHWHTDERSRMSVGQKISSSKIGHAGYWLGKKRPLIETHPFFNRKRASQAAQKRVKNGTHHFLSGEIQRREALVRLSNGTHNFLRITNQHDINICPKCGKHGKGPAMLRWHFDNCKSVNL